MTETQSAKKYGGLKVKDFDKENVALTFSETITVFEMAKELVIKIVAGGIICTQ